MYGIAFGQTFLNQGSALVHVYTDGSVLLSHGGMEMGQVSLSVAICYLHFGVNLPDTGFAH